MLREIWMRDIRLCMRDDALRVLKLSRKYELGVEVQYFKDPKFNYVKMFEIVHYMLPLVICHLEVLIHY